MKTSTVTKFSNTVSSIYVTSYIQDDLLRPQGTEYNVAVGGGRYLYKQELVNLRDLINEVLGAEFE